MQERWKRSLMCFVILGGMTLLVGNGCFRADFAYGPTDWSYSPLVSVQPLCADSECCRLMCLNFQDERDTETVGGALNAFGGTSTKWVCEHEDLTHFVTAAVTNALRGAGYVVAMNPERTTGEPIPYDELRGFQYLVGGKVVTTSVNTRIDWHTLNAEASIEIYIYLQKVGGDAAGKWLGPLKGDVIFEDGSQDQKQPGKVARKGFDAAMRSCMIDLVEYLRDSGVLESN